MSEVTPTQRRILVTSALPYANGHIHIGHLVEYLQTDIWVRFQRSRGHRVVYVCADDTHGAAIMIRAQKEGRSPLSLITEMQEHHTQDFAGFGVSFDHYGSTNSPANEKLCHEFWAGLRQADLISQKDVTQLFDPPTGVFLADRFVKGKCPKCQAPDQYGDSCEKCGATYSATELLEPRSVMSGAVPELKTAAHYFVEVEKWRDFLEEWVQSGALQPEIANYLKGHFLSEELRAWDVSRPAPYFGFEIPDAPGNYWYVWFDAPIGYLAATAEWCEKQGEQLDDWWRNPQTEVRHFIGKDITYFHTLFWPVMLRASGYSLPTRVQIHGFLTVNGEKMSKSRGTMVRASTYLQHLDPAYLRYFYASKLTDKVDDLDLDAQEFVSKINSDLVGKVVNLASRTARFVEQLSPVYPEDEGLFEQAARAGEEIAIAYEHHDFAQAMRLIMRLADRANEYLDRKAPWKVRKEPERQAELRDICTVALNLYRQIIVYLSPVLPQLAADSQALLGGAECSLWSAAQEQLVSVQLAPFSHLMNRVDPKKVEAMIEESKVAEKQEEVAAEQVSAAPSEAQDSADALAAEPLAEVCSIDDFAKVDLRVARVLQAEQVPEARKLLKLTVSLGGEDRRTIFAGIKSAYEPEQLVGRLVVIVANLAPRQMKFGLSEGMVVCAGSGGKDLFVLSPDSGAQAGQRVH